MRCREQHYGFDISSSYSVRMAHHLLSRSWRRISPGGSRTNSFKTSASCLSPPHSPSAALYLALGCRMRRDRCAHLTSATACYVLPPAYLCAHRSPFPTGYFILITLPAALHTRTHYWLPRFTTLCSTLRATAACETPARLARLRWFKRVRAGQRFISSGAQTVVVIIF